MKISGKLLTLTLAVGLAFFADGAWAQNKVLKVGVIGPFTGPSAKGGAEYRASSETAFEKVNYRVGDYKIEFVWIDSQSDPAKAANAYTEAIEKNGIDVSFGVFHSSVGVALMDISAQYKNPIILGSGAATSLINEKWDANPEKYRGYYLKAYPVPAKLFNNYVSFVDNLVKDGKWKPANRKVAVFAEDTDWGHSALEAFKDGFAKAGWEIVSEDLFPPTQTDFYQMLGRYKSQKVSVIAGVTTYPALGALIKQKDEVKLNALVVADRLADIGDWYKITGNSSDLALDMLPDLTTDEARAWSKKVQDKYGFTPSTVAGGMMYDSGGMLIKVMKRANEKYGEITSATIAKIVTEEVIPGQLVYTVDDGAVSVKEYRYSEETAPDPLVGPDNFFFPIVQYKGGQPFVVYPEDEKQADFIAPK